MPDPTIPPNVFVRDVCLYVNGREYRFSSNNASFNALQQYVGNPDAEPLSDADAEMYATIAKDAAS